jgi:hypothetical protein
MPTFTDDPVISISTIGAANAAVLGESNDNEGVRGISHNAHGAVVGVNDFGPQSTTPSGPPGTGGNGGFFHSEHGEGVRGESKSPFHGGVVGVNTAGGPAGYFSGSVFATDFGITGADCAETFEVGEEGATEPGTVMVIGHEGSLYPCREPYDRRVGGVISGAGSFATGITLDKQPESDSRKPLALIGKVYCKADAGYNSIEVGDLLTTSGTPGYAMKATDSTKAFGSVLGKALAPLRTGQGLIPILVTLQ